MQTWYPKYEQKLKKKARRHKARKPGNFVKRMNAIEARRISGWKHRGTPGFAV